jgi:rhamnopyranosyl-N-acetylglucosaminyl-diphospho-decaprenol beta-1,3/1,4-galactofuranosyltransferase
MQGNIPPVWASNSMPGSGRGYPPALRVEERMVFYYRHFPGLVPFTFPELFNKISWLRWSKKENRLEKIAALVLTYNRKDLVIKTIEALAGQSFSLYRIFVVDNASTDGTDKVLEGVVHNDTSGRIEIVTLEENFGSSGGFARGMEYIFSHSEADWLWIMDDDAVPEERAAEKFRYFYRSLPAKKQETTGVLLNQREIQFEKFKNVDVPVEAVYGKPKMRATFEGYLIRREAVAAAGYPRSEFFIYSDDIEYTWRVINRGYRVYRVYGAYIYHRDWAKIEKVSRGLVAKPNIPPWKLYYRFRNPFLVVEKYPVFRFFLMIVLYVDLLLWSFINRENAYFARRGLSDGINLVSGKTVSPETLPVLED